MKAQSTKHKAETALPVLNCDGCGACCTHIGTPPGYACFFPPRRMPIHPMWKGGNPDWVLFQSIPPELIQELRTYYDAVQLGLLEDRTSLHCSDVPCLWYDERTRRCAHYEHRPSVCRSFEVGSEACLGHRARLGIESA